ncbi:MAG TPA: aldehyde dehydrogenase (NADP(+)) [Sphingomonas sp.]
MQISGHFFVGRQRPAGKGAAFHAVAAASGDAIEPAFHGADAAQVAEACRLAQASFDAYRARPLEERARFLEAIADSIVALGDALIVRCMEETGLPRARLEGERGRTTGQLRMFADAVRSGLGFETRFDPALPDRAPLPRPDLRLGTVPLGPVAVFGASNFPLAFSVAGGDTASALAAGCPVVVKAHSAHPGTSEMIASAVADAVAATDMPEGVFSLIFSADHEAGLALVADPRIKAVGFTGSQRAGLALIDVASHRPEPIPVYAEMSAINPVLLLPHALAERGGAIAEAFVASLTLGAGQFCTNPGLILALKGPDLDRFLSRAADLVDRRPASTMLTPAIHAAYGEHVDGVARHDAVELIAKGAAGGPHDGIACLLATSASAFLADPALHEEMFGAASLVVRCADMGEMTAVLEAIGGQLTVAIHATPDDHPAVRILLPIAERKAGRILFGGFGTGVEVAHAMVHGGPFPATSDSRTTSVGSLALTRFLRPVCYQDCPVDLLPEPLRMPPSG